MLTSILAPTSPIVDNNTEYEAPTSPLKQSSSLNNLFCIFIELW